MKFNFVKVCALLVLVSSPFISSQAIGADKSMAEAKIVLQISDPNPFKQQLVLNVANNLVKHYGQDLVDIEIVAFGPGLRLLFEGNAKNESINSLSSRGVKFSACENTSVNMGKKLGHSLALNPNAVVVKAGAVRIVELVQQGYTLIKP